MSPAPEGDLIHIDAASPFGLVLLHPFDYLNNHFIFQFDVHSARFLCRDDFLLFDFYLSVDLRSQDAFGSATSLCQAISVLLSFKLRVAIAFSTSGLTTIVAISFLSYFIARLFFSGASRLPQFTAASSTAPV